MTTSLDERLVESTTAALELYGVHLGRALGLYLTLAEQGPRTAGELADAAGIDARYAREWLEQQAVAAYLVVEDASRPADQRRYLLPTEHFERWWTPTTPPMCPRWPTWSWGSDRCCPRSSPPSAPETACPIAATARTSAAARAASTGRPSRTT